MSVVRSDILQKCYQPLEPLPTEVEPVHVGLSGLKAVLFDIYGTLFISGSGEISASRDDACNGALDGALDAVGIGQAGLTGEAMEHYFTVVRASHAKLQALGIDYPEVDIVDVWREVLTEMSRRGLLDEQDWSRPKLEQLAVEYEARANPVWPMPGAEQLLAALRSTDVILGIVSNAQFYTPLLFEALLGGKPEQLGFCSDLCIWSYQERTAKPSDRLLRKALDRLRSSMGIRPQQVLYVGNDMRNDIVPAVDLCCRSALFAGDRRSYRPRTDEPLCRETVPDLVVTDLRELIRPLVS